MVVGHRRGDLVVAGTHAGPVGFKRSRGQGSDRVAVGKKFHLAQHSVRGVVGSGGGERDGCRGNKFRSVRRRSQLDRRWMVDGETHLLGCDFALVVLDIHGELRRPGSFESSTCPADIGQHYAVIILGPVSRAIHFCECISSVYPDRLDLAVGIVRHDREGELAWHRHEVARRRRGADNDWRQVARGEGDLDRRRHGLGSAVVGDGGANLVNALARTLPRKRRSGIGRLAKGNPVGGLDQFALVQNAGDRAVGVGGSDRDNHVTWRAEEAAILRRGDGHRRRLVVGEVADGDRLVIVHHQRDRLGRAAGVALPLLEAQPRARLGREGDGGVRRVTVEKRVDLNRAVALRDGCRERVMHVDLDRVAVLDAEGVSHRHGVPAGVPRREVHQLQLPLGRSRNRLAVLGPLDGHRRADGIQPDQESFRPGKVRASTGDGAQLRLAVEIRHAVRRPRKFGGQLHLHRLHGCETRLAWTPARAVVRVPSDITVGLQQAKLGAGWGRGGELQIVPGRAGERRRIAKVPRASREIHLITLAKVRTDKHRAERLRVRVGELENAPLAKLDRAVAPRVAQLALGPLAGIRVENGHFRALGRALEQRGDGLAAAQRHRDMVERLARRNVEVHVADAIARMTGKTARSQLVRHQYAHKLLLCVCVVCHRDAHQPVLVLVVNKLVPAHAVGGALDLAVGARFAREQENKPALFIKAGLAEVGQNVVAAEVRGDRLVRVHRHGDRLVAAGRVAAPVHPRVTGRRSGRQGHLAPGEKHRLFRLHRDAAAALKRQLQFVINIQLGRLTDRFAKAIAHEHRVTPGVGDAHDRQLDRRRGRPGDRLAIEQPLVGEWLANGLDDETDVAAGQHLRICRLCRDLRQRRVVAPVQRAGRGDNERLAKRDHRLTRRPSAV